MVDSGLLRAIPPPAELRRRARIVALLDCALSGLAHPDPLRRYRFVDRWRASISLASMRNGAGDEYSIVFCAAGVYVRGYDSTASPVPGITDGLPNRFSRYVTEQEFQFADGAPAMTLCVWYRAGQSGWQASRAIDGGDRTSAVDGSARLFDALLDWNSGAFGAAYRDQSEPDPDAVQAIMNGAPISRAVVRQLNPNADFSVVERELAIMGRR